MLQDIFESRIYFLFNWWWWTWFQITEMLWKMSLIKTFRWPKHDYFRGVLQWMCYASLKSIWWPICPEHDDVIKWKHFPRYWPFVRGIHQWPVNFPHKGQWRGALMFSLICARTNRWVNNRNAGDLRRHRTHYDVTVIDIHWPGNVRRLLDQ